MLVKVIIVFLIINIVLQMGVIVADIVSRRLRIKEVLSWSEYPEINIKYFNDNLERLGFIEGQKSNWIDLRCAEDIELKAGEFKLIPLGVAMELPEGYEAHVIPRSSTFKTWGILQTNSMGLIDQSYKGDTDQWFMPVYATRDTKINFNDRICQFRIIPIMGEIEFNPVSSLDNESRGGHGSSGTN